MRIGRLEPGFDIEVLKKCGNNRTVRYYMGVRSSGFKFIGWYRSKNGTNSSLDIFEKALIVKHKHMNDDKFLATSFYFTIIFQCNQKCSIIERRKYALVQPFVSHVKTENH